MKKQFAILTYFFCLTQLSAQWVATVAGVLETPGFNDGPALSSRFFNPHGVAVDAEGKVYVADRFNHTIRLFDPSTGLVSTLAGKALQSGSVNGTGADARFNEPWGICVSPDGIVYVADTKNNKIRKVMPDGTVSTYAGTGNYGTSNGPVLAATFGNPTGIEIDEAGNIYVADHLTHIIRKINTNGIVSTLAGIAYIPGDVDGPGNEAQFWRPYGLTLDNEGNIIVADEWNHKIRKVTPQGVTSTIAGNGQVAIVDGTADQASFNYPWDMTVDPVGNIYVADGYNYVIRKIGLDGSVTSLAGSPQTSGGVDGEGSNATFSGATSIAWSTLTGTLFVGDAYNHLIREISLDGVPTANLTLINLNASSSLCEGDFLNMQASPSIYDFYRFYIDGELVQDNGTPNLTAGNIATGTHTVTVEAGFQGDILVSNIITITVTPIPQADISVVGPLSFFEGDSVILVASGSGEFLWSTGESSQTITVFESGTYFVETTVNGCTGISDEVTVDVTLLPNDIGLLLEGNSILCPGEKAMLISTESNDIQWLRDGWLLPGAITDQLEVKEGGIYQVQYTDPVTFITALSNEQEITVLEGADFDFVATPRTGKTGQNIEFLSTGNDTPVSYSWDFGDPDSGSDNVSELMSPSHIYETEGLYTVSLMATAENGCRDTISKRDYIDIGNNDSTDNGGNNGGTGTIVEGLFIPNAFTPNGDGENDIFRVRGFTGGEFNMTIFNHWGEMLFLSESADIGWDGTRNGLPVHAGTYVYLVILDTPDGTKQLSGHITLLR